MSSRMQYLPSPSTLLPSLTALSASACSSPSSSASPSPAASRNAAYQRFTHTLSEPPAPTSTRHQHNPITLTRFVHAEQSLHPTSTGSLTLLLHSLQLAVKLIGQQTRRAGLGGGLGSAGGANASGESQKTLDVWANECMLEVLTYSERVDVMVSEEEDEIVVVDRGDGEGVRRKGGYSVVFDPLDGSSNVSHTGAKSGSSF